MSAMLGGCLPDTEYMEVTAGSGHRYGVWVTTPPGYAEASESVPVIYVMDGNFAVGLTAPLIVTQSDPYLTVAPYIQVTVGYAGEEAANWTRLRNRDLVPPGEPVSEEMVAALRTALDAGLVTQEHFDAYLQELQDTHADAFLAFLIDELHPLVQSRLRVSDSGHGLFGYSYGGLFAVYAWLQSGTPFATVGAGSPGIISAESKVFDLMASLGERGADSDAARLHVTLNEAEMLGEIPVYRLLAQNVLAFVEKLHASGRSQDVSKALCFETHVTGLQASFLSYLKTCHVR